MMSRATGVMPPAPPCVPGTSTSTGAGVRGAELLHEDAVVLRRPGPRRAPSSARSGPAPRPERPQRRNTATVSPSEPHICSGASTPEQVERPREHPLRQHADRDPHVLVAALLGRPDHPAVAVEGGEVLRRLGARRRSSRCGARRSRRLAHLAGQLEQPLDERARRRMERLRARAQVGRERLRHALLARLAQDRRDPRVRVLHVVDGVVLRLARAPARGRGRASCRGCAAARNQRAASTPMSSTRSSSVTISPARLDICARSPPSMRLTSCMIIELEALGVAAERRPGGLHPRHVAVVVGAPARRSRGRSRARACPRGRRCRTRSRSSSPVERAQHAVLVVAEARWCAARARPRARRRRLPSALDRAPRSSPRSCSARSEKKRSMCTRKRASVARTPSSISSMPRWRQLVRVRVGRAVDPLGQLGHVVALVAVLRRLLAARARPDRLAEALAPGCRRRSRSTRARHGGRRTRGCGRASRRRRRGGAARPYRPGRVGAHELDLHALAARRPRRSRSPASTSVGQRVEVPGVGHEQVEEARARRPRRARRSSPSRSPSVVAEPLGDRARRLAQRRARAASRRWSSSRRSPARGGAVELQRRHGGRSPAHLGGGLARRRSSGSATGSSARPLSSGTARRRGSCGPGRAARAAPPGRAGAAASSRPSESRMSRRSRSSPRGPPMTKQRSRPSWRRSSSHSLKLDRVELAAVAREQHQVGALGDPLRHAARPRAPRSARLARARRASCGSARRRPGRAAAGAPPRSPRSASRLRYYARVRGRRAPLQHPHRPRDDGGALRELRQRHRTRTTSSRSRSRAWTTRSRRTRCPASSSRAINLSPRFMRELIDAMEDNFSKWQHPRGHPRPAGARRARRDRAASRARSAGRPRTRALDARPVEVVGRVRGPVVVRRGTSSRPRRRACTSGSRPAARSARPWPPRCAALGASATPAASPARASALA